MGDASPVRAMAGAVRGCSVQGVYKWYGWAVWGGGLGCLLWPKGFAVKTGRWGKGVKDSTRLLGVWLMCGGAVVRDAAAGRRPPCYLLPLTFLMSSFVTIRRSVLDTGAPPAGAVCLALLHFAALLIQAQDPAVACDAA